MNAIIVWSVRNRGLVAALAIVWLFLGAAIARRAPLDVFPEFVPPQVTIQAEAPGFAPEQVEQIVTKPIEDAVNGTQGLDTMRSESVDGLSVVTLTFAEGADPINVRQGIAEKLTTISGTLPTGVAQPTLSPLTSSTMDVLKIGLVSDTVDPFELRDLARWVLKPQLLAVPGIARVSIFGGAVRQIHIEPKIDRLTALGLTIADVVTASRQSLALRGAGFIDTGPQRVTLEASTPVPDPHALAATLVTTQNGVPIRLGDVSTVTMAPALELGDAVVQGRKGVLLTISGQYGENTLAATQGLEARLGELTPILEKRGITVYPALHRPATFVERALANLEGALALGGLLILIVLYAFLRNFRAVLISFVTIPLSLFAAIAVLTATGQTLNTMTLGGFAVALGVLVDDAIIDIENIMRRLRQSANQNAEDRLTTIEDASIEIRGSMLYGTLAVILVFLPVLFAGGVQGRFVAPMAVAFVLAVVASLVVAVTVTPALCALLIRYQDQHAEAAWIARVKRWHVAAMAGVQRAWILLVVLLAALATGAAARLPYLESELIPPFREGHFVLQVSTVTAGTSLDEMVSLGERISAQLLALPFVATVEQQIGRAEAGEDTWTTDRSEFHVELTPHHDVSEDEAQEQIRGILERIPEVSSETLTFLGDRISESISGETAQVVVNVTGNDLAAIEHSAADIGAALTSIPGLRDLQIPKIEGTPTLSLRLDTVKLTSYGLSQQDALDSIQTAFSGATVGQTYAGSRTVDVVVILPPGSRNRLETLDNLMLGNLSARLPLRKIASIKVSEGRANIQRRSGVRRAAVTFNASGRPLQDVVSDARARAGSVQLPNDVYVEFTGQAEAEREGQLRFAGLTLLASVLIVLVMTRAFQRRWLAAFVLVNVPFCLLGSIAAIDSTHIGLTLGSLVGLVVVFGIGARNSIMLLAHAEHLVDREGFQPTRATIERAASERFVPVVMTALMAALGLVPLALGLGLAGHEIEAPMAIAVLGGLFASTFLNLVVLPELAVRLGPQVGLMRESEV